MMSNQWQKPFEMIMIQYQQQVKEMVELLAKVFPARSG